jgi:hypothetical protein
MLVWAANFIKLYAATKWLGQDHLKQDARTIYKIDDYQNITLQTKLDLRNKKRDMQKDYIEGKKIKQAGKLGKDKNPSPVKDSDQSEESDSEEKESNK